MRCAAAVLALELPIALPDHTAVLVGAVPYLGAIVFPAIATDDLCREGTQAVVMPPSGFAYRHLRLHLFPLVRVNDRRVALFHYVLRDLALVHLHLLGKEIYRELLLQDRTALVLLVRQDAFNGTALPFDLPARRRDALLRQMLRDPVERLALNEKAVYLSDDGRFLRDDLRQAIRSFAVAEEGRIRHRDLSVRKALPLAPCDVFGNGAAFLLGKAAHDGQ